MIHPPVLKIILEVFAAHVHAAASSARIAWPPRLRFAAISTVFAQALSESTCTMVRSEIIGAISAAPISTAFCTIKSMFFPFGMACPRTIRHCSGGVSASCNFLNTNFIDVKIDNFRSDFVSVVR